MRYYKKSIIASLKLIVDKITFFSYADSPGVFCEWNDINKSRYIGKSYVPNFSIIFVFTVAFTI